MEKELSKGAILSKWGYGDFAGCTPPSDIEKAMQEFADQQSKKEAIAFQTEIERLKEILKKEFYYGLRAWGYDFQKNKLWEEYKTKNNL